jgi:hypothetical protein
MFAGMSEIFKNYADVSDVFKNCNNMSEIFKGDMPVSNSFNVAGCKNEFDFDHQSESSTFNPAMMYLSGAQKNLYDEYMKQLENIF